MRDNKAFTQKQDSIIKNLYENQNIKKWSIIARTLTQQHNMPRNAKQCRDRYQQFLAPMMISQWSPQQQRRLYNLHDQLGNKWAVIAQKFVGRTDNCVKNHFYAKLRKSLRHLNKVIKNNFKKQLKQLKIEAIYKIIQALQDRFNQNTMIDQDVFNKCLRLKRQLLLYADQENTMQAQQFSKQKQLIKQIMQFSRSYKRKTKKQRRNSLNGLQLFKHSTLQKRIKYSSDQQSQQSEYSLVHSVQSSIKSNSQKQVSVNDDSQESEGKLNIIQEDIRQSMYSNINIRQSNVNIRQSCNQNNIRQSNVNIRQSYNQNHENNENINLRQSCNSNININIRQSCNSIVNIRDSFNSNMIRQSDSQNMKQSDPNFNIRLSQNQKRLYGRVGQKLKTQQDNQRNMMNNSYNSQQYNIQQILKEKNLLSEIQVHIKPQKSLYSSVKSESQKPDMFDDNINIAQKLINIQENDQQSLVNSGQGIFRSHR